MLVHVRQPRIPTAEASSSTVRRRSHELRSVRESVSGGDDSAQLADEIQARPINEKQSVARSLIEDSGFKLELPASVSLALKAKLHLPWSKLRDMRR